MKASVPRIIWFSPSEIKAPKPRGQGGTVRLTCACCSNEFDKQRSNYVYQLRKAPDRFFCTKACFHESRRLHKAANDKKAEKAAYDRQYRKRAYVKVRKAESHKRNYNPEKQRAYNQLRMAHHVEYCRRPEYRAQKKEYDQVYQAKKSYGEFWQSSILINQIEAQYNQIDVRQINNLQNKTQKRKRAWKRLKTPNSQLPQ